MSSSSPRSLHVEKSPQKKRSRTPAVSIQKNTSSKKYTRPKSSNVATPKKRPAKKASPKKTNTSTKPRQRSTAKKASPPPTAKRITKTDLRTLKREPLGHLLVEQKLREAGFRGTVSTNKDVLKKYSTDESIFAITPQIVIQPKDEPDVEIAVTTIATETKRFSSLSLTPRAAGTGLSGGSLTDSIVIDVCTHMHQIQEVHKKSGQVSITLEPGVMWRDMEKTLRDYDVYIPSATSSKDICSVGGCVGNNAAGPDSLRYGHTAEWIKELNVVLADGVTYTIKPLTYKQAQAEIQKNTHYGTIIKNVLKLLTENETEINNAKPKTKKNNAGYALWDVLSGSIAEFKKGQATLDIGRIITGSQGTVGIVTRITFKTLPIAKDTTLLAVPVFDLATASSVVLASLQFNPINVELFDALTFELALKNPDFFKDRLDGMSYYKVMLAMYTTYHVRWRSKTPEFTFLVTVDGETDPAAAQAALVEAGGAKARIISNSSEAEMFWQIRRASYSLSKFQDKQKRPAAFLEDMTVPPANLGRFFVDIKKLFKKYNVHAAVHGHGGNGHFHFYPLLDFTKQGTGDLVEKMAEEFYTTATKYKGSICGEHNDGIIRTPHLRKLFSKHVLSLFAATEHLFDPDDIFNPGKKVHPRFDIKETLRKTN